MGGGGTGTILGCVCISGCNIDAGTGSVSNGAGEKDCDTETGAAGVRTTTGTSIWARVESELDPSARVGLPHDLQNLAPSFNCKPQWRHFSPAGVANGSAALVSDVAHFVQNFVPGRTLVPHDGQALTALDACNGGTTAEPHRPQNFPDVSVLHLGHFIMPLLSS